MVADRERRWCSVDGCSNYSKPGGTRCSAHYAQLERKGKTGPVRDYGLTVEERYQRAMTLWADADTDEDLRHAWRNVLAAGREFHRVHGSIVMGESTDEAKGEQQTT